MDYLRDAFMSQDGIVKIVVAFALFIALVPNDGLLGLHFGGNNAIYVHGAIFAILMALICAGYMWVKEKYLEKETFY